MDADVTSAEVERRYARVREALARDGAAEGQSWDPRLSTRGNRVSKQLMVLLDRLAWAESFLQCRGWTSLLTISAW